MAIFFRADIKLYVRYLCDIHTMDDVRQLSRSRDEELGWTIMYVYDIWSVLVTPDVSWLITTLVTRLKINENFSMNSAKIVIKAFGHDGLPAKLLKARSNYTIPCTHQLTYRISLENMRIDRNLSVLRPVLKNRNSATWPNCRTINPLAIAYKVLAWVLIRPT